MAAKKQAKFKLTKEQAASIMSVENGADVYAYGIAKDLREVQRATGDTLVKIVKAVNPPENGAAQQPYFGAIATLAGLNEAHKILNLGGR